MTTGLIEIMKKAALQANDAHNLCDVRYGTVIQEIPLQIKITNDFILPESVLVLPERLRDWSCTGGIIREDGAEEEVQYNFYNHLRVNDHVVLLRKTGGKHYIVLDRVYGGDEV